MIKSGAKAGKGRGGIVGNELSNKEIVKIQRNFYHRINNDSF